jgi:Putative vitamin uptake transporter
MFSAVIVGMDGMLAIADFCAPADFRYFLATHRSLQVCSRVDFLTSANGASLRHTARRQAHEQRSMSASIAGPLGSRSARLFIVLAAFLAVNALCAEFVGVKVFALEPTLGFQTVHWDLFGQSGSLSFTSGVLLWPFVFLMTDVINEYFGRRGVQFISWLTVGLISYGFFAAYVSISLVPAQFWVTVNQQRGVPDMQVAFSNIFGQGMWTIVGRSRPSCSDSSSTLRFSIAFGCSPAIGGSGCGRQARR